MHTAKGFGLVGILLISIVVVVALAAGGTYATKRAGQSITTRDNSESVIEDVKKENRERNHSVDALINSANNFQVLNEVYKKNDKAVWYKDEVMLDADANSFIPFPYKFVYGRNDYAYAKDINGVYCDGEILSGADPRSFTIVGADADTFNYPYYQGVSEFAKDEDSVFHACKLVAEADPETLEIFFFSLTESHRSHSAMYKDKNNVYIGGYTGDYILTEKADAPSFEQVQFNIFKDVNSVYCGSQPIEGADPKTFEILYYDFQRFLIAKDRDSVFFPCREITDVDYDTFRFLGGGSLGSNLYAVDKNNVYAFGIQYEAYGPAYHYILEGADPLTFSLIENDTSKDAEDKNRYYRNGKIVDTKDSLAE